LTRHIQNQSPPNALTIAGSDSGGGAGIQADIKTFVALQCYGASVITALTAQNTARVSAVFDVSAEFIGEQIDAIFEDIPIAAVKTGMLPSAPIVEMTATKLREHAVANVVVDPVMVTTHGQRLIDDKAADAIKSQLLPLATVVTPNITEARILSGAPDDADNSLAAIEAMARAIMRLGSSAVLIKGGHGDGSDCVDVLFDGASVQHFSSPRIDTKNTHGTGCTLSAAIAAFLARGESVADATRMSKDYITEALAAAFPLGKGNGPVNHFYKAWST